MSDQAKYRLPHVRISNRKAYMDRQSSRPKYINGSSSLCSLTLIAFESFDAAAAPDRGQSINFTHSNPDFR
jgi:hypothetical protein